MNCFVGRGKKTRLAIDGKRAGDEVARQPRVCTEGNFKST